MNPAPHIVVIGSSNTDMVIRAERIPRLGETVIDGTFITAAGGKGANQAVAAARLGAQVTFIARVGNDPLGDQAVAHYQKEGIDTQYMIRDPEAPSGVAFIMVDAHGENCIAVAPGANAHLQPADIEHAASVIAEADVLLMQQEIPMETVFKAADMAHQAGVLVILNPAPAKPLSRDLLSRVSVLTPNEHEISVISGLSDQDQAIGALQAMGVETVLITEGSKGVFLATGTRRKRLPAFSVQTVDTTAAGDAFNGGLAVALGRQLPLEEAIQLAMAVAAISVTRMGAQPSLPHKEEVERFLSQHAEKDC